MEKAGKMRTLQDKSLIQLGQELETVKLFAARGVETVSMRIIAWKTRKS